MISYTAFDEWFRNLGMRTERRNADKIIATMVRLESQEWDEWLYGLDIMRAADLRAGSFYEAMAYLEEYRVVEAMFEEGTYPRRRLYRRLSL